MNNRYRPKKVDVKDYDLEQPQYIEAKLHFNEVVLMILEVYRIVGYYEDDSDVYYVLKQPNNPDHIRYSLHSGVCSPMYLKDRLPEKDYAFLDNILEMNGCPPEQDFILGFPKVWKY